MGECLQPQVRLDYFSQYVPRSDQQGGIYEKLDDVRGNGSGILSRREICVWAADVQEQWYPRAQNVPPVPPPPDDADAGDLQAGDRRTRRVTVQASFRPYIRPTAMLGSPVRSCSSLR